MKNTQKGFVGIIGLVVVLAIIAGGGWYVAKKGLITSPSGGTAGGSAIDQARQAADLLEQRNQNIMEEAVAPVPNPPIPSTNLPKLVSFSSVGTTEESPTFLENQPNYQLTLSPFITSLKSKKLVVGSMSIELEAVAAHEDDSTKQKSVCTKDKSQCFQANRYLSVLVNASPVDLFAKDIVELVFDNGRHVQISAVDVEGRGSSVGSDLLVKEVKR